MTEHERQQLLDEEHLRLLRIGYLVGGGIDAAFALFPLIYVAMGLLIAFGSFPISERPSDLNPAFMGLFMTLFGCALSLFLAVSAGFKFAASRAIRQRRSRTLCMVAGAVSCLSFPWGTVLGVFTFMVLGRASVAAKFASGSGMLSPPPVTLSSDAFRSEEASVGPERH
jgi:hypothetical protein